MIEKSSSDFSGIVMPWYWAYIRSRVPSIRNRPMTKNWIMPLTIMFLREAIESRQARWRCIMSWLRPFITMAMNTPAMNCFQK